MDLPYLEYWHWDNDRPDLSQFPKGHYALMLGSLFSGYKFKGTFDTVALAVEWLDKRPLLGKVSIVPVQDPDTFSIHVGSNPSISEPDEMDATYPPGDYMVITRNVFRGIRFWGYFSTLRSAVEWIEARQPEIGNTSVVQVEDASLIPSQVEDDPEIIE